MCDVASSGCWQREALEIVTVFLATKLDDNHFILTRKSIKLYWTIHDLSLQSVIRPSILKRATNYAAPIPLPVPGRYGIYPECSGDRSEGRLWTFGGQPQSECFRILQVSICYPLRIDVRRANAALDIRSIEIHISAAQKRRKKEYTSLP
ncbi:hypothetical protein ARMSODRAFT_162781 [Armillaria solidipes]|uniref:Uncharacterized protein n=1 Tax=Armillaria solidipes TaxID=1076256 RepID=A0A2H3BEX5_9AGAR|nr:hypothetical protein ARMSODRAFT_162781 [Armillaria solidipes]